MGLENGKGTIAISYLVPAEIKNPFRQIDFSFDVVRTVQDALAKKYPKMRYIIGQDDMIAEETVKKGEKELEKLKDAKQITNLEVLMKLFPHVASSTVNASHICPAIFYGLNICPKTAGEDVKDIQDVYNMNCTNCRKCAKDFWRSQYDGAELYNKKTN